MILARIPFMARDAAADRVVPPTGHTATLTVFTAAAMAFLAVFALALAMATGRLSDRWADALARTATIRLSTPLGQMESQTEALRRVLDTTPGIARYRVLPRSEQQALLTPWFGPDLPLDDLPLPRLIELTEDVPGYNADSLRLRLAAEAPGAVLDDHTRWRRPLVQAAQGLRRLGWVSLVLIAGSMAAMVTLAAQSALAANGQIIKVLRLVGARDLFIAKAFIRRFTLRALMGAAAGTGAGMIAVALLPGDEVAGGVLTGLGFVGSGWLIPLVIPPLAAAVAYFATRRAALRLLRGLA